MGVHDSRIMDLMNIVFISSSFYPSIGGVETHVLELSKELVKLGHKVTVITEDKPGYWHSRHKGDSEARKLKSIDKSSFFVHKKLYQIDIYYFKFGEPSFLKKFRIWYSFLKHTQLFKSADIIHCHDVFVWYLPLRFFLFQKKIFTTFHGYETVFPPKEKAIWIRRLSEKLSYGNICIGDFIKKWYGTKPDYVVYGGVKKTSNIKSQILNVTQKRKLRILLVGRLEKDIGIQIYKGALRKLKDLGIRFEFTACGGGSLSSELESYGKVHGFVPKIKEYMKKTDFVFASSYLTMLDAFQAKKPVFSVYTNPLKHDYLCASPFKKYIYVSHDSDKLASQILKYTPQAAKLSKAASWANSQTWKKVAQVYLDLWAKK